MDTPLAPGLLPAESYGHAAHTCARPTDRNSTILEAKCSRFNSRKQGLLTPPESAVDDYFFMFLKRNKPRIYYYSKE